MLLARLLRARPAAATLDDTEPTITVSGDAPTPRASAPASRSCVLPPLTLTTTPDVADVEAYLGRAGLSVRDLGIQ